MQRRLIVAARVLFVALMALGAGGPACADVVPHRVDVTWRDGRLSVDADGAPLAELLAAVARAAGVEWRGLVPVAATVSCRFADRSLGEGLETLLRDFNYALVGESATAEGARRPILIVIGAKPERVAASAAPDEQPATAATSIAAEAPGHYRLVERLAEHGSIADLREAALHGDPTTRALALQRLARRSPADAAALAASAARSDDSVQRVLAVQVLGGLDSAEALRALREALADPDEAVRQAAVVALAGKPFASVAAMLERASNDDAEPVRGFARQLLALHAAAAAMGGR